MESKVYYVAVTETPVHSKGKVIFRYTFQFNNEIDILKISEIIKTKTEWSIFCTFPIWEAEIKSLGLNVTARVLGNPFHPQVIMSKLALGLYRMLLKKDGLTRYKQRMGYKQI